MPKAKKDKPKVKETKKKVNHDHECCECGKPATHNIQNWWHDYLIDKDGDFLEVNGWEGDCNDFYCNKCFNKEFNQ